MKTSIVWHDLVADNHWYVGLSKVTFNGIEMIPEESANAIIVDSGTSNLFMPMREFHELTASFTQGRDC